jgi:hypothetical protein
MADGALSIKLRCASWQQLATIYKRDLSHGTMFLRAAAPPAVGRSVRIELALPSASVIVLTGVVHSHVQDPQRGAGVVLALGPIPAGSLWLIESALASEHRRPATPVHGTPTLGASPPRGMVPGSSAVPVSPSISDSADVTEAEQHLIKALVAEAESLKQLNPFLVLGVGYEATDREVRAAFGELTRRYHPDRFARYESPELHKAAEDIFLLIRDAYRRLADAVGRAHVQKSLDTSPAVPRVISAPSREPSPVTLRTANTQRIVRDGGAPLLPARRSMPAPSPMMSEPFDVSPLEDLIDQGRLDEALVAYRVMGKKYPHDRPLRAGVLLCEGLRALAVRDRSLATLRFEAALEIDPSNERAARALADMRRQATNERKGLLSRLMGKEP